MPKEDSQELQKNSKLTRKHRSTKKQIGNAGSMADTWQTKWQVDKERTDKTAVQTIKIEEINKEDDTPEETTFQMNTGNLSDHKNPKRKACNEI